MNGNYSLVIVGFVMAGIASRIGREKRKEAERVYMEGTKEQLDKFAEDFRNDLAKQAAEKFGNR